MEVFTVKDRQELISLLEEILYYDPPPCASWATVHTIPQNTSKVL